MKTISKVILGVFFSVALACGPAVAGQLVVGLGSEPSSIDPHYHNLGPNNQLARHIFESMVHADENQRLGPGLAVSWKPINDTTWEFKLRQGVTFHDGSPTMCFSPLSGRPMLRQVLHLLRFTPRVKRSRRSMIIPSTSSPRNPTR